MGSCISCSYCAQRFWRKVCCAATIAAVTAAVASRSAKIRRGAMSIFYDAGSRKKPTAAACQPSNCRGLRMHRFLQNRKDDLRYAVRTMRNNLGFTAIATLSLALGIGANTAIFSLVDALLLKMLPVGDPQRLYVVTGASSGRTSTSWTYPDYRALRDYNRGFSGLIAYSGGSQASGF